jgi:formyl transferase-like protein
MVDHPSSGIADASNRVDSGATLKIVALLVGEPQAMELWTLKKVASLPGKLWAVRARKGRGSSAFERLKRLTQENGIGGVTSRLLASKVLGPWEERQQRQRLDQLLDGEYLRKWWCNSGIESIEVPHLNHAAARSVITRLQPDIIVRVSGGVLKRRIFSLARIVTLNIHHGVAPRIRGLWSIPWGIVEGRCDWIGATVHEIDDGIDTGRIVWRGSPQIAPGDTGTTLLFRAHLEAVEALVTAIRDYAAGATPASWPLGKDDEESVYRSAPGVWASLRYLYLRGGRHARVILERAWR